jgi:protein involved in polysaccharide export with SLBB domain
MARWRGLPAAAALVIWAEVGCQTSRPITSMVVTQDQLAPDDRLGVDDVFDVRVFDEPNLSGTYRVSADGTVDYPLIGRVKVYGLRSGEIQAEIAGRLQKGEYLKSPQVSVMVKEWNSRKISVIGQVQRPGSVPYFPRMTIVEAIAAAGGFTGIADKNKVTLRREREGVVRGETYRVKDISEGRASNVTLAPGDILVVDERLF